MQSKYTDKDKYTDKERKVINMDIDRQVHADFKAWCAKQDLTMKEATEILWRRASDGRIPRITK